MRCRRRLAHAGAAVLLILGAAACSVPPEQPIVSDFFAASRLRDTTALARFATVVFEPRTDGTVSEIQIEQVSPERVLGNVRVKQVTVRAHVRQDDGREERRRLVVTLQKPDGAAEPGRLYDGWIVTGVTDADEGAAPRS